MKMSTVTTHLCLIRAKAPRQSQKQIREVQSNISWLERIVVSKCSNDAESRDTVEPARKWSERYAAQLEQLRARVDAGTYHVESVALARCILVNETHFCQ